MYITYLTYKKDFLRVYIGHTGWLTNNDYSSRVTVMLVNKAWLIRIREGEKPKTPRHASVAASRNDRLPHSQH